MKCVIQLLSMIFPFFEKFQFESSWEPHLDQCLFKNNMYICVLMMFSKVSLEAHKVSYSKGIHLLCLFIL